LKSKGKGKIEWTEEKIQEVVNEIDIPGFKILMTSLCKIYIISAQNENLKAAIEELEISSSQSIDVVKSDASAIRNYIEDLETKLGQVTERVQAMQNQIARNNETLIGLSSTVSTAHENLTTIKRDIMILSSDLSDVIAMIPLTESNLAEIENDLLIINSTLQVYNIRVEVIYETLVPVVEQINTVEVKSYMNSIETTVNQNMISNMNTMLTDVINVVDGIFLKLT